jgi:hypothetical protein
VDGVSMRILISHADRDRAWAEWARWHLGKAGYEIELDGVDWAPGTNVIEAMDRAVRRDNPVLALLSSAYLERERFTTDAWTARFAQRRRNPDAKLIPLRVEDVDLDGGLWAPLVVPDVFDLPPDEAVKVLMGAVRQVTASPPVGNPSAVPPTYPGRSVSGLAAGGPRPPGSLPPVWNLARRNAAFTGRDVMLNSLHATLVGGSRVAVQALHGLGGVGKTQLALEYAHRFAGEYELVWWIPSEQPELVGDHLAALAQELRLVVTETPTPEAVEALRRYLRGAGRWLLVFDNAEDRDHLAPWLPDGPGDLLITSRNPNWTGVAHPVDVDVFTRDESNSLLRVHLPHLGEADADRLAEALGDLPLAVGQAMDLLAETRMPVGDYLRDLAGHTAGLMREGRPLAGYPVSLAATVTLTADRLRAADPAAGHLLYLCSRLGPEPIPMDLFTARPDLLPDPLIAVARTSLAFGQVLAQLRRYGLCRLAETGPVLHRLVGAVLRDNDPDPALHRATVERLLVAARPDNGTDPRCWPRWTMLLPHILAADPATTDDPDLRAVANIAVWHLNERGEPEAALPLAQEFHQAWQERHGPDDDSALYSRNTLAAIHRHLGDVRQARDLDEENLARKRRLHGEDHRLTLVSASNLANDLFDLGEFARARELNEDTLARSRRVLGDDHPDTIRSMASLANDLFRIGDFRRARNLNQEALSRFRTVLGEDHPDTLRSARAVARDFRRIGLYRQGWILDEDTLARSRRVLGDNHPDTRDAAFVVFVGLFFRGRFIKAFKLLRQLLPVRDR